ncbi:carboxypeptidase-like regulatory domain-containing protein [Saccharicrinis sp. FJH2]|uniref:TonB-dependent receptor n=1 Tax=Saccharicrinis sp. FJH65 TaxID=3344659 RepID=UPI0035F2DD33
MLRKVFAISIVLIPILSLSQIRVSGYVRDNISKELLIGANVYDISANNGTITNLEGYFSFFANSGDTLKISYIGYQDTTVILSENLSGVLTIKLKKGYSLDAFNVFSTRWQNFNSERFSSRQLEQMPSLGSKPDVLKSIQNLPGISTQNEGSGSILVRGGSPGQNLYLLDNVPLIYVYHLGGFMSVFNPDIINGLELYKSGFPAKYGGKLSSIINISQKEGNMDKQRGNVSIGLTDLSFAVEGPLNRNKNISYILTGRKTMTEPLMMLASYLSGGGDYLTFYGFHDLNGKVTFKKDPNNSFYLNLYYGDDYLSFVSYGSERSKYNNTWGNWLISSRWKHNFNSGMTVSNILSYNNYRTRNIVKQTLLDAEDQLTKYRSKINNMMFVSDWNVALFKGWAINYGLQSDLWFQIPNEYITTEGTTIDERTLVSNDLAVYVDNKVSVHKRLEFNLGGRLMNYTTNGFMKTFIEPRLQLNYKPASKLLFNFGYMAVHQGSHLLSTQGDIMHNEVWVAADNDIPLSVSDQYSAGWKYLFQENTYEFKMDVYHKKMSDLVEFREGYSFMPGDINWRKKVETGGEGKSDGIEVSLKKQQGRLTGSVSYDYSKTTRKFSGINKGNEYVFDYDRPHNVSVLLNYKLTDKLDLNALWVYHTGLPYTPVIGRQLVQNPQDEGKTYYEALIYGERNSARMQDYHRLDLSLNYKTVTKRGNKAVWTFSVYNAYARQNAYYYYYNDDASGEIYHPEYWDNYENLKMYKISYFPFIPSVSYKVYFGDRDNDIRIRFRKNREQKKENRKKLNRWLYYED